MQSRGSTNLIVQSRGSTNLIVQSRGAFNLIVQSRGAFNLIVQSRGAFNLIVQSSHNAAGDLGGGSPGHCDFCDAPVSSGGRVPDRVALALISRSGGGPDAIQGVPEVWWNSEVNPSRPLAIVCLAASILSTIAIALLGPSAMVPPLAGRAWQPPYSLNAHPDGHLVIFLGALAIVLGAIGLAAGLATLAPDRAGPSLPDARWLLVAGCLVAGVLAFLPPFGSADHLNYAAYGRMAALGHDPYVTVPSDMPTDPVIGTVEEWKDTPSVYGPVATAVQALSSLVGGDSVRLTVFGLALFNAAAFVATALSLHHFTRRDPVRQRRAALLWTVNPLVIYQLAAGMHLDTLAIAFMIAALVVGAASPAKRVWQGVLLGLGVAVKVTVGLVALGPAWELRKRPGRLALVAGTATLTVVVAYWSAGPNSLDQVLNASKSVSFATSWKLFQRLLQALFGSGAYRVWIQIGSLLLLVTLAWLLLRALRGAAAGVPVTGSGVMGSGVTGVADGGVSDGAVASGGVADGGVSDGAVASGGVAGRGEATSVPVTSGDVTDGGVTGGGLAAGGGLVGGGWELDAPRVAVAFVVAWLFATPYALPWYDGLAFALLAMIPATALDGFMVARLTVLSLAYLPARQADQPTDLGWLVSVVRSQVAPLILLGLTVGLVWWARSTGRTRTAAEHAQTRPV